MLVMFGVVSGVKYISLVYTCCFFLYSNEEKKNLNKLSTLDQLFLLFANIL